MNDRDVHTTLLHHGSTLNNTRRSRSSSVLSLPRVLKELDGGNSSRGDLLLELLDSLSDGELQRLDVGDHLVVHRGLRG